MIQELVLNQLTIDPMIQCRTELDSSTVESYAVDVEGGSKFPPITVFEEGEVLRVADGFHRVEAYRRAGQETIPAEVHEGDIRKAILHSVGANAAQGLRRTNRDKRRAVEKLLLDEEWSEWPSRKIARVCRVTHPFVSKVRRELAARGNGFQLEAPNDRPPVSGRTSVTRTNNRRHPDPIPDPAKDRFHRIPRAAELEPEGSPRRLSASAIGNLQGIDLADPIGLKEMCRVRTWIDRQLEEFGEKESSADSQIPLAGRAEGERTSVSTQIC